MRKLRNVLFLLLILLSVGAVASAQGQQEAGDKDVEIVFWSHLGESPEFVHAFAEKATEAFASIGMNNFTVRSEIVDYGNYEQKYLSAFSSGKGPDIFFGRAADWALDYGINPIAAPFREDTQKVWDEALMDLVSKQGVIDGKRFGIPYEAGVGQMLYYNKDHFIDAGLDPNDPPETLEEMAEYAEALTKRDKNGNITRGGYGMRYLGQGGGIWDKFRTVYHQFGAVALSPDGKTADGYINSPESLAAFTYFNDLVRVQKAVNTSFDMPETAFKQGLVSMIYREPWLITSIADEVPNLNYGLAPIPSGPAGLVAKQIPLDGWNYLVNSQSKYVDEIMDMLIAFCNVESDVYIHQFRQTPPVLEAAYDSDYVKSLPYGDIITTYAQSIVSPEYYTVGASQAITIAGEELVKMVLGEQTPEEAVAKAADRMDEMLATL
ncbi:extracellular solute-binding protein [uncultured Sphaerochaeta sp.]|uniref:extracellular solute-binding protein n=1 Tax=uncultured Sphaerochaeta sp. TaxID=886478 RepID=UPI002A0A9A4E|nr:extracellular solute-binding protein [uncultured Sphaerochaeta sp.]